MSHCHIGRNTESRNWSRIWYQTDDENKNTTIQTPTTMAHRGPQGGFFKKKLQIFAKHDFLFTFLGEDLIQETSGNQTFTNPEFQFRMHINSGVIFEWNLQSSEKWFDYQLIVS